MIIPQRTKCFPKLFWDALDVSIRLSSIELHIIGVDIYYTQKSNRLLALLNQKVSIAACYRHKEQILFANIEMSTCVERNTGSRRQRTSDCSCPLSLPGSDHEQTNARRLLLSFILR